ncbi:hypothetical protein UK23_29595 [Lentzea aerocolonigenes]|uniref:Uncharacterized protein n=1 Tax=Lentzea aerocolonigenes TaxID=68170 RepID=A0A0F0GLI6_LENAE|nr:hypothetical protein [Lentzea aerocolonigenes]KJK44379.1 hypothetical protein UK23_29595 [Lentzea aerocolonigenes]
MDTRHRFPVVPEGTTYPGPHSDTEARRGMWLVRARYYSGHRGKVCRGTTFVVEPGTDVRAILAEVADDVRRLIEFYVFDDQDRCVRIPGQLITGWSVVLPSRRSTSGGFRPERSSDDSRS